MQDYKQNMSIHCNRELVQNNVNNRTALRAARPKH